MSAKQATETNEIGLNRRLDERRRERKADVVNAKAGDRDKPGDDGVELRAGGWTDERGDRQDALVATQHAAFEYRELLAAVRHAHP